MWDHLYQVALRYLLRLGLSYAEAEDIAQEALLSTYLHVDSIQEGKLISYLLATARNRCIDLARRNSREIIGLDIGRGYPGKGSEIEQIETKEAVDRALSRLNLTEQKLFCLKYRLDLTTAEISARLNTSPNTVKALLWRLRKKLREYLEEGKGS